uniref:Uncharacterized protein n=1 Tax=Timema cristinae TaxID=61476 RepID=A0A7R9CNR8_TIMCR|nr:unnamed protein product [Timema cristinae]
MKADTVPPVVSYSVQDMYSLGMQFFLRNTGFFGVLPDHLFDINPSWCEWLHSLVEKGIDSGVVRPFARKVFTFFQEDEALRFGTYTTYLGNKLTLYPRYPPPLLRPTAAWDHVFRAVARKSDDEAL